MVTGRDLISKAAAGAWAVETAGYSSVAASDANKKQGIPVRELGGTGEKVSMLGIGGDGTWAPATPMNRR
jgi:hypothetical protein